MSQARMLKNSQILISALTVCVECLVKLLSVLNRLREDFDGLKPQDKLAKGVDTVHEVS